MNLATFLHAHKEFKDSTLPLPLSPLYSLPQHKWFFSSSDLVPLRKRRQNSCLYKYMQQFQSFEGQKQEHKSKIRLSQEKSILCLYESSNYLKNKLKHIFDTIWMHCRSEEEYTQLKIKCSCQHNSQEDLRSCITNSVNLYQHLNSCKKQFKDEVPSTKSQHINWLQFTKTFVNKHLNLPFNIQDQLHLCKLPINYRHSPLFNILWNNSYLVFNNDKELNINQHMKAKAVELADLIGKKMQNYIWTQLLQHLQPVAEEVIDNTIFFEKAKKILTPSSFRVWFYKKQDNNQIYIVALTDFTFKGVQCVLYSGINLNDNSFFRNPTQDVLNDIKAQESIMEEDHIEFFNKIKSYSEQSKSSKSIRTLVPQKVKLTNVTKSRSISINTVQHSSQANNQQEQPTETQCACCKDLLLSCDIVNQITANHIEEIKYLKQMKIGKIQHHPYDFVKVCPQCYSIYLKHLNQTPNDKKKQTRKRTTTSFYQNKQKKQTSQKDHKEAKDKQQLKEQLYKSKEEMPSLTSNSSQRHLMNKSHNTRPNSELNASKQQTILENTSRKNYRGAPLRPKLTSLPSKIKKTQITHTSNTQTLDCQPIRKIATIKEQLALDRAIQNKKMSVVDQSLPKSRSFKLQGCRGPKYNNIINRIILHSKTIENIIDPSDSQQVKSKIQPSEIITQAIEQYENVSRPSFTKLLHKNKKHCYLRETPNHSPRHTNRPHPVHSCHQPQTTE